MIDLCYGFTDASSPLGGDYSEVVAQNRRLIDAMHAKGLPVIFTTVAYDRAKAQAAAAFMAKVPALRLLEAGSRLVAIDERLGMTDQDTLIVKQFPSAFFGTAVSSLLASAGCDTVICTGVTTSGCVRATAVDAVSYGYTVVVPREACGDRAPGPHDANLFDIQQKYGDVVSVDAAVAAIEALEPVA